MKFDFIVGNPPYHVFGEKLLGGNGSLPVYHKYVKTAERVCSKAVSMIIPSRWMFVNRNLDDFRRFMLRSKRIAVLTDYIDSSDIFPSVAIGGGICWFVLSKEHRHDDALVQNSGIVYEPHMHRSLNEFSRYVRLNSGVSVIRKVIGSGEFSSLGETLMYDAFRISSAVRGKPIQDKYTKTPVYTSGGKGYITYDATSRTDCFNSYKLVLSRVTNEYGFKSVDGKYTVFNPPVILQPFEVCTESYSLFSGFHTKYEVLNLAKYINTKFVRFIVLNATSSINISPATFVFVPLQDFSNNSDIDWAVSIESIDCQLYDKYGLSEEDITSIENRISPYREVILKNIDNKPCLQFDAHNGWISNQ